VHAVWHGSLHGMVSHEAGQPDRAAAPVSFHPWAEPTPRVARGRSGGANPTPERAVVKDLGAIDCWLLQQLPAARRRRRGGWRTAGGRRRRSRHGGGLGRPDKHRATRWRGRVLRSCVWPSPGAGAGSRHCMCAWLNKAICAEQTMPHKTGATDPCHAAYNVPLSHGTCVPVALRDEDGFGSHHSAGCGKSTLLERVSPSRYLRTAGGRRLVIDWYY
jgi:hypothetical protein